MAKIPLSLFGYLLFPRPISTTGCISIAFGLSSGVHYTRSKLKATAAATAAKEKELDDALPSTGTPSDVCSTRTGRVRARDADHIVNDLEASPTRTS